MAERHVFLEPWRRGMYIDTRDFIQPLDWRYALEKWMYGASVILGALAFAYTVFRLCRTDRKKLILAARLFSYKLSLTAADVIILFLYAPCQFIWISTFWWYAGDGMCRMFKFMAAFGFHLTANMQVLVAFDRLYITATMRTCRLSRKKEPYNTSACLLTAWALAFLCSCPQLIVFGTSSPGEGKEQCVSIWLQRRMDHMEKLEYLRDYAKHVELRENVTSELYFPNGTLRHFVEKPDFSEESIKDEAKQLMYFEQAYNVVHLTTICVLPYLLELFCYTLILYLLKGAQHGRFLSISDALRSKFCCARKAETHDVQLPIDRSVSITSMDFTAWLKKIRSPQRTQSISEVALPRGSASTMLLTPRDNRDRSASCSQLNARQPAGSKDEQQHVADEATVEEPASCAASCLGKSNKTTTSPQASSAPWMTTVSYARRKARIKAFWMLSVNLLLWSPYCLVGVMNAVTIFPEFANFQFAAALVAFNSISNLVL